MYLTPILSAVSPSPFTLTTKAPSSSSLRSACSKSSARRRGPLDSSVEGIFFPKRGAQAQDNQPTKDFHEEQVCKLLKLPAQKITRHFVAAAKTWSAKPQLLESLAATCAEHQRKSPPPGYRCKKSDQALQDRIYLVRLLPLDILIAFMGTKSVTHPPGTTLEMNGYPYTIGQPGRGWASW